MRLDSQQKIHKQLNGEYTHEYECTEDYKEWEKQRKDGRYIYLTKSALHILLLGSVSIIILNYKNSGEFFTYILSHIFLYSALAAIVLTLILEILIWNYFEKKYKEYINKQLNISLRIQVNETRQPGKCSEVFEW